MNLPEHIDLVVLGKGRKKRNKNRDKEIVNWEGLQNNFIDHSKTEDEAHTGIINIILQEEEMCQPQDTVEHKNRFDILDSIKDKPKNYPFREGIVSELDMRDSEFEGDGDVNSIIKDGKFHSLLIQRKDDCPTLNYRYPIRSRERKCGYSTIND